MKTRPPSYAAISRIAFVLGAAILLATPGPAFAFTGRDPVFSRSFFDRCSVQSVRARLGPDGASVKYWVEGTCPSGNVSGQVAFRNGAFNEVYDLGGTGILRSRGDCSDNPWVKAARCENVAVQGEGPGVSALLAEQPYSPGGEIGAPFSLNVPGASAAFRKAHDTAERPNPPIAPVGVRATQSIGSKSVQLSWLAPDESGDRPYLHFLVQARPRSMEGAAWTDLGRIDRGSKTAYATSVRLPPPVPGVEGWDLRLCSATALAVTCGAPQAPTSVAGNAISTAPVINSATPANPSVRGAARVTPTPPANTSSICERAAAAQARHSPAAEALAAKCRAEGGQPGAPSAAPDLDALAAEGMTMAADDPLAMLLRASLVDDDARRGFDVAVATIRDQTEWGPGKQKILDSLAMPAQSGFKAGSSYLLDRNKYADRARLGAAIVAADAALAAERDSDDDARSRLGFDIATAIFGDPAHGAQGNTAAGPGSLGIRNSLSTPAQRGFDAAMKMHLSRSY